MKKIICLYIIFLLLSCESLGVNEYTEKLSYYEYVGFGWTNFFDRNYDIAIEYFQTAIDINEVQYINSANVGKAWTYLMMANQEIGTSEMSAKRDSSDSLFEQAIINSLEASELYNECDYAFCCNDCFIDDYEVGIIYGNFSKYFNDEDGAFTYEELVSDITTFINEHIDTEVYNLIDGKPNTGNFNLTTNNLILLLAQLHFLNEMIYDSCVLLDDNDLCSYIENFDLLQCDQSSMSYESINLILSCMQSFTPIY